MVPTLTRSPLAAALSGLALGRSPTRLSDDDQNRQHDALSRLARRLQVPVAAVREMLADRPGQLAFFGGAEVARMRRQLGALAGAGELSTHQPLLEACLARLAHAQRICQADALEGAGAAPRRAMPAALPAPPPRLAARAAAPDRRPPPLPEQPLAMPPRRRD